MLVLRWFYSRIIHRSPYYQQHYLWWQHDYTTHTHRDSNCIADCQLLAFFYPLRNTINKPQLCKQISYNNVQVLVSMSFTLDNAHSYSSGDKQWSATIIALFCSLELMLLPSQPCCYAALNQQHKCLEFLAPDPLLPPYPLLATQYLAVMLEPTLLQPTDSFP